jgi:hypothetical protein
MQKKCSMILIFYDDFVVGGVGDAEAVEVGAVAGAAGVAAGAPGFEGSLAVVEPVSTGFTSIF